MSHPSDKQRDRPNPDKSPAEVSPQSTAESWRLRLFEKQPWVVFLLPLLVFMLVGSLEPTPPKAAAPPGWFSYEQYPLVYGIKIALVSAAIIFVWPGLRGFKFRVSLLAIVVGLVGGGVWIGICNLELEKSFLNQIGMAKQFGFGERSAFNPFEQFAGDETTIYAYLAMRFIGLVAVIAIAEELFLRGFLMRYLADPEWWKLPFGTVNRDALIAGTVVPMLMHPGELIAAFVWFSMITWLMLRNKNLWDCIAAHAVTNLVLGIYVVAAGDWRLI